MLNEADIELALNTKKIKFTNNGKDITCHCPECGKNKLAVSVLPEKIGKWQCFGCDKKGSIFGFFSHIKFEYRHKRVMQKGVVVNIPDQAVIEGYHDNLSDKVYEYLIEQRKFTVEAIEQFKLGSRFEKGKHELAIPHYENGIALNVKFRAIPPAMKTFRRIPQCKSVLYNIDKCKDKKQLIIIEGELDVIAMWIYGFDACSSTIGASGEFEPEWISLISEYEDVVFLYDEDGPGIRGALKSASLIGKHKCRMGIVPQWKDVNKCLIEGVDKAEIEKAIKEAKPLELPLVKHISCFTDGILDRITNHQHGIPIPSKYLDNMIMGWRGGELTIITGHTGKGKTTFVNFCMVHALNLGCPCLLGSFEMGKDQIFLKMASNHFKKNRFDLTRDNLKEYKSIIDELPLVFLDQWGTINLTELSDSIKFAAMRTGVKLVILDNFGFIEDKSSSRNESEERIIFEIKTLARSMDVHIILICHPRKDPTWSGSSDSRFVEINELKGASAISQCADNVLSMMRDPLGKPLVNFWALKLRDAKDIYPKWSVWFSTKTLMYYDEEKEFIKTLEGSKDGKK